mmetsp:Transcript_22550/g.69706  ORF Transcript_22550/g.69706 Transcript_22550/m.69706 type:complete len:260 (-) Transcript_22550:42-821(-)
MRRLCGTLGGERCGYCLYHLLERFGAVQLIDFLWREEAREHEPPEWHQCHYEQGEQQTHDAADPRNGVRCARGGELEAREQHDGAPAHSVQECEHALTAARTTPQLGICRQKHESLRQLHAWQALDAHQEKVGPDRRTRDEPQRRREEAARENCQALAEVAHPLFVDADLHVAHCRQRGCTVRAGLNRSGCCAGTAGRRRLRRRCVLLVDLHDNVVREVVRRGGEEARDTAQRAAAEALATHCSRGLSLFLALSALGDG